MKVRNSKKLLDFFTYFDFFRSNCACSKLIKSPAVVESDKDSVQEKEHVLDDIEKDLQLEVETDQSNGMDFQLNPDAKEFVPLPPVRNEFQSPPPTENDKSPFVNQLLSGFSDNVVL